MRKIFLWIVLLLLSTTPSYAQWERIEVSLTGKGDPKSPILHGTPHPLQYYLRPSPERDPSNSLCLGCPVTVGGRGQSLKDFVVEASQHPLGVSFGRKIIEVVLSFRMGPELMKMHAEKAARETGDPGRVYSYPDSYYTPVARWKSIIMESSSGQYQELYLLFNTWELDRPLSEASLFTVGGTQVLTTVDYFPGNGAYCADSYWVLNLIEPRLIDFNAADKEVARLSPPDTSVRQNRCWALSMDKLEVSAPIQRNDAPCTRCDLGTAVVHFKLDGHRAVPVSSFFEPCKPEQNN